MTNLLAGALARLRGGHRPDTGALSAYVDGRLDVQARTALEAHLPACPACTAQLAELRAVRNTLAAMPQAEAPRSFRLRAADVEAPVPARPSGFLTFAPSVAAVAVFLLVIVGGADLATRGGDSDDASSGAGLTAQRIENAAQADSADKSLNNHYSATPGDNAIGAIAPDDGGETATGGADAATPEAAAGAEAPPALEQTTRSTDDDAAAGDAAATAPAPQPAREDDFAATVNYGEKEDDRTAFRVAEFTLIAVVVVAVLGVGAAWLRRRDVIS